MDAGTVAIVVALVGPLFGYLAAARKMSGRIQTTEASDLWAESASIREWSASRIKTLNALVAKLENRVDELEQEREELISDKLSLMRRLSDCEAICARLMREQGVERERRDDARDKSRDVSDAARDSRRQQSDAARERSRDKLD